MKIITIDNRRLERIFLDAVKDKDLDKVASCIKRGVNLHIEYDWALRYTCRYGNLDMAKLLIENGANVNAKNGEPLSNAQNLELIKYLVDNGAHFNHWSLIHASRIGNLEIVKYFIEKGVYFKALSNKSIKIACSYGHLDVVKYLISQYDKVENKLLNGLLYLTIRNNHLDVIEYLVSIGADERMLNLL